MTSGRSMVIHATPLAVEVTVTLIVAPLARAGAGLHVARLRLPPGSPLSAPALARSCLHRSLAPARGSMSLGCASLQGRLSPRRRSLAHVCTPPPAQPLA